MILPTKKILEKNLKGFFASHIFSRGVRYYKSDLVDSLKAFPTKYANKIEIRGGIEGGDYYYAGFVFDLETSQFERLDCDCPYDDDCKHLAALGLEFINMYEIFLEENRKYDIYKISIKEFRGILIEWINYQPKAESYEGKGGEIGDEEDAIIEAEFEEIESGNDNTDDILRKSLSAVGIDIDSVSSDALKVLQKDLAEIVSQHKKKKEEKIKIVKEKQVRPIRPKKFNPENYYIILDCDYGLSVRFRNKKQPFYYGIHDNEASQVLRKYRNSLNTEHKELFNILKDEHRWYRDNDFDYGILFVLLKKSGIRIYRDDRRPSMEMFFGENPDRLKAELILEKRYNDYYEYQQHDFIFKLGEQYADKKTQKFFYGKEVMIQIENTNIYIHKISKELGLIMNRIDFREIHDWNISKRVKRCDTALLEGEIINLNQIIKDGREHLDLNTDLVPDYNIMNFNKADPCLVVDYNYDDDVLKIKPSIDYGSYKQDVSKTVYYNKQKNRRGKFIKRKWRNQDKYVIEINDKDIFYSPVNEQKEISFFKELYNHRDDLGFTKTLKCNLKTKGQISNFLKNNWDNLRKFVEQNNYSIYFIQDELNFARENFKADFDVDLNVENDWLGFDVDCYCGQDKISLEDLKKYMASKKEFIKMEDGRLFKIANREELERFILMLESFYAREAGGFEGRLYHAPELENIFTSSKYYNAKVKKSFDKFIKEVKSGKPIRKIRLPVRYDKVLRDYQKAGIDWFYFLRKYRFAGVLADDMGLGKTLQSLILIGKEKVAGRPSIVICPKTLLYNWQLEAEKFTPKLKTIVIDGLPKEREELIRKAKKYDLAITGYATMQKDAEIYEKKKLRFNYCILDEAQFIKNHTTKNAQIVKKISADFRLALTGTPLENSVSEVWSIFDFLMPGFLGTYNSFVRKFQNPIMKQNSQLALENLRKKIECFMLRRTKREVLKELPPKVEQVSHCHLDKEQNILYQEILANVKKEIFDIVKEKGFNKSRIHILAGLTKLRQVCNHPVLLLKNKDHTKYESAKLNMFLELIDEIVESKRKVLVFSQFTSMLDILARELKKKNINYNYLSGKTKNRQELVKDFNENETPVFLISLKAGGTGLNLISADNVIIFDPWWNPSVENQAIDRTHRIGQKNSVNVYRLITTGTIEERIVKLQEKKKFLFDNLVGESKDLFQKLTWDDVKKLFV